jgi:hypothetical protein
MKKLKIAIMTSVILFSIVAAFATTRVDCKQATQYYSPSPGVYLAAGVYGQNYVCANSGNTCTPCQLGDFNNGSLVEKEKAAKK